MHPYKRTSRRVLAALLLVCALCGTASAADVAFDCTTVYCLSQETFSEQDELTGIYISAVPSAAVCEIRFGERRICAGDVLPVAALSTLTVTPTTQQTAEAALFYRPISAEGLGTARELAFTLRAGKNTAPVAEDGSFETYKNIENSGVLNVRDAEGDALTYKLVHEPKRGTVKIHADGTFTYTPGKNKVGKDSFSYTVTDSAGNVSNEATVKLRIRKPTDKAAYTDLSAEQEYLAMWMKEQGVYSGRTVDGNLCFAPEESISRGEFLIMAMALFDAPEGSVKLSSGFADEGQTPVWMRPYIVSAFRSGVISGSLTEAGMVFRPTETLTHAEAAVMLQGILELPEVRTQVVFSDEEENAIPSWAREATAALASVGVRYTAEAAETPISRYEACKLLMDAWQVQENSGLMAFRWAQ